MKVFLSRALLFRFLVIFVLCLVVNVILVGLLWRTNTNEIQESEAQFAFGAMASGPLEFARSYSTAIADDHLKRVFSQPEIGKRGFLGGEIRLIEEKESTIAKWYASRATSLDPSCIKDVTKLVQGKSDYYPYKLIVSLDTCRRSLLSRRLSSIAGVTVFMSFVITIAGIIIFYLPITRSIRSATQGLREPDRKISSKDLPYEPIRTLYSEALKAREVAELKKIKEISRRVAHDIRSPLTALNVLASTSKDWPESKQRMLTTATGRITAIAEDLLTRSKSAFEKDDLNSEMLDNLLTSILDEKKLEHCDRNIDLQHTSEYGVFSKVNSTAFKAIISNLINNGTEAGATRITISLEKGSSTCKLTVKDNGKGIQPSVLNEVGRKEISTKSAGHGIGLKSAFTTIEQWKGQIKVVSTIEATAGTTVIITLPTAAPPNWYVSEIPVSTHKGIVVCDDDDSIHELLKDRFKDLELVHFNSLSSFQMNRDRYEDYLVLLDNEFPREKVQGIDVVETLTNGILMSGQSISMLEGQLLNRRLRFIPKSALGAIPLKCRSHSLI